MGNSQEWQADAHSDPLPWLLEEENPSARYLTLCQLLDYAPQYSRVTETQAAIVTWPPVREILESMDPVDFWGRADKPFYGGAVGTHAMLNLLADLGMPRTSQIESACENIFEHGQHANGGFSYDGAPSRVFLCYTGKVIATLIHFGYRSDPRLVRALDYLTNRCMEAEGLTCPYADGDECQWGITKALAAFAALPPDQHTRKRERAIQTLANGVLDHAFDFDGRDARWLDFGFPLDYQSDLAELCDVLARLDYSLDPRFTRLMNVVLDKRTPEGQWLKEYGTRAFQLEKKGEPSKWITIRALRALKHTQQARDEARVAEL